MSDKSSTTSESAATSGANSTASTPPESANSSNVPRSVNLVLPIRAEQLCWFVLSLLSQTLRPKVPSVSSESVTSRSSNSLASHDGPSNGEKSAETAGSDSPHGSNSSSSPETDSEMSDHGENGHIPNSPHLRMLDNNGTLQIPAGLLSPRTGSPTDEAQPNAIADSFDPLGTHSGNATPIPGALQNAVLHALQGGHLPGSPPRSPRHNGRSGPLTPVPLTTQSSTDSVASVGSQSSNQSANGLGLHVTPASPPPDSLGKAGSAQSPTPTTPQAPLTPGTPLMPLVVTVESPSSAVVAAAAGVGAAKQGSHSQKQDSRSATPSAVEEANKAAANALDDFLMQMSGVQPAPQQQPQPKKPQPQPAPNANAKTPELPPKVPAKNKAQTAMSQAHHRSKTLPVDLKVPANHLDTNALVSRTPPGHNPFPQTPSPPGGPAINSNASTPIVTPKAKPPDAKLVTPTVRPAGASNASDELKGRTDSAGSVTTPGPLDDKMFVTSAQFSSYVYCYWQCSYAQHWWRLQAALLQMHRDSRRHDGPYGLDSCL